MAHTPKGQESAAQGAGPVCGPPLLELAQVLQGLRLVRAPHAGCDEAAGATLCCARAGEGLRSLAVPKRGLPAVAPSPV